MAENAQLGARLAKARQSMGPEETRTKFGKRFGVSRSAVSTWEKTGQIKRSNLVKVAGATGYSVSDFTDSQSPLDDSLTVGAENGQTEGDLTEEAVNRARQALLDLSRHLGREAVKNAFYQLFYPADKAGAPARPQKPARTS